MKVLIPSDNREFITHWVTAYRKAGCEVVTGTFNFDLGSAAFDLVHYQWPEELSEWKPPSENRLKEITARVQWWADRCPAIVSVNNLYCHGYEGNSEFKKLYNMFYDKTNWVHHFSLTSKNLIRNEFSGAQHERHIVTNSFNYDALLPAQKKRGGCRTEFELAPDDFVILVIGALRSWAEVQLISKAFASCRVRKKQLLMAGRYNETCSPLLRRWRQAKWRFWLWRYNAKVDDSFVPDEELYRLLDSADVVVVPRFQELNSGIPNLAMTFGKMLIAPSHGAFPELLSGTENLLYESGNPSSLAAALEQAEHLDFGRIGAENRKIAERWSWDNITSACLTALEQHPRTRSFRYLMPPFVSILIPCYNAGPWVAECIQSALDQTYLYKEVVVVDDGSTDNSLDVINRFGGRIRFESGPNRGGNVARNRLLALSSGEWLEFLDADDYLLPQKIESQIALLDSRPNGEAIYSPGLLLTGESRIEPDAPIIDDDLLANYFRWDYFTTTALLLKKSAVSDVGGWKEDQEVCQEHELVLRLIMAKKQFVLTHDPMAVIRLQSSHSVSRRSPLKTLQQKMALSDRLEAHLQSIGEMNELRRTALAQSRLMAARSIYAWDKDWAFSLYAKALATGPFGPPVRFNPLYLRALRWFGFGFAERLAALQRGLFGKQPTA